MKHRFTHEQASELLGKAARMEAAHGDEAQSFLDLEEVKEAARAAGIDPRWVEAALSATGGPGDVSTYWGIPISTHREVVLDDPIDSDEWGRLVLAIRGEMGTQGTVESLGSTYTWSGDPYRLTVINRSDGASVRVEADWSSSLKGLLGTGLISLFFGAFLALTGLGTGEYVPMVLGTFLLTLGILSTVGPTLGYRRKTRKAQERMDKMLETLGSIQSVRSADARRLEQSQVIETGQGDLLPDQPEELTETQSARAPANRARS
jgi:hypothetical protein